MKNYKLTLFALFLAIGIIGFSSCKDQPTEPVDDPVYEITLQDLSYTSDFVFIDGDMNSNMMLQPYSPMEEQEMMGDGGMMGGKRGGHRNHDEMTKRGLGHCKEFGEMNRYGMLRLGRILGKLNLTEDQIASIDTLRKEHMDCLKLARETFYTEMKAIMETANADRKEIMVKFRNGELTREEASKAIRELNVETRTKIANSEAMKEAMEDMKKCRETFFAGIEALLDADQLVIWKEYLEKLQG